MKTSYLLTFSVGTFFLNFLPVVLAVEFVFLKEKKDFINLRYLKKISRKQNLVSVQVGSTTIFFNKGTCILYNSCVLSVIDVLFSCT